MKWLHSININKVHIESNCMQVVSRLNNNKEHDSTEYGVIIGKCRSLISSFENCKINYVRRQDNRVVHELVQTTHFNVSR
jgi:hypothetical protein